MHRHARTQLLPSRCTQEGCSPNCCLNTRAVDSLCSEKPRKPLQEPPRACAKYHYTTASQPYYLKIEFAQRIAPPLCCSAGHSVQKSSLRPAPRLASHAMDLHPRHPLYRSEVEGEGSPSAVLSLCSPLSKLLFFLSQPPCASASNVEHGNNDADSLVSSHAATRGAGGEPADWRAQGLWTGASRRRENDILNVLPTQAESL